MNKGGCKHCPGCFSKSYWLEQTISPFPQMIEDERTEVGVIGGGIVGIMTAYLLSKAGKKVVLVEGNQMLRGVTGHTTAKISAQHGLIYDTLIQTFGERVARLYYEANLEGLALIQDTSQQLAIACGFEIKESVVFASSERTVQKIEAEARAYETLEIDGVLSYGSLDDLPFPVDAALIMRHQAQFHPVQFLSPLLAEIEKLGGLIYENTRATHLSKDGSVVYMENGAHLTCDQVVVATHYPFNDFNGLYLSKLSIERSYLLAAKVSETVPQAMYLSADSPSRSLRSVTDSEGSDWLLIGGDNHQTGKSKAPTRTHYDNLEAFGRRWFGLEQVPHRWSAQDMTTLDQVPYIGQMVASSENVYVATGFNKWGMAMGALAGKLITDLILDQPNRYKDLFDPLRSKIKSADIKAFTKKNTSVAKDLVMTTLQKPELTLEELKSDEGGLVAIDGKKYGGYRDVDGELHVVKTTCTHLGCGLRWNDAERSWDCACHGSRFSYKGDVLNGPAVKPLEKIDIE